jgi:Predicted membrane protein
MSQELSCAEPPHVPEAFSAEEARARLRRFFPGVKLAGEGASKDSAGLPAGSTAAPEPAGEAPTPEGPSRSQIDAPSVEGLETAAPAEELGEPGGPSGPPPPAPAASGGGAAAPSSGRTVVVKDYFSMQAGREMIAMVSRDEKEDTYFWTPGEAKIRTDRGEILFDFGARRYLDGDPQYHIDPDAKVLIEVEVCDKVELDPRVREATLTFKTGHCDHPRKIKFDLVTRTWSASTPPEGVLDLKGDGRPVPFDLGYSATRAYFTDMRKLPEALVMAG